MEKMLLLVLSAFLVTGVCTSVSHERATYYGYKVLRTLPKLEHQLHLLRELQHSNPEIDFWSEPKTLNMSVDMMIHQNDYIRMLRLLDNARIAYSVLIDDVQKIIDEDEQNQTNLRSTTTQLLSFTKFNRLNEIHSWMQKLSKANSNIAEVISIGQSSQGRDLKIIKISTGSSIKKPAIWIDAGIHAREWIAPATATYIIDQLINNYASNKALVNDVDWYILPVVNPDGYEYTHTNSRLWRKTRSANSNGCKGTDANRNWGFHWNEGGSSSNPCSDTYRGPSAFSEPETKLISEYILQKKDDFKAFLTLHSYGQMWLTPWGFTSDLPSDYSDLISVAKKATKALTSLHGTRYKIGSSTNVLYIASGGSDDWAKGVAGIKYAYTVELRDTGYYGFVLPASSIIPTGEETFKAVKVVAKQVIKEFEL